MVYIFSSEIYLPIFSVSANLVDTYLKTINYDEEIMMI